MTLGQFGGLFCIYLIAVIFILTLTYQEFRRVKFNFNVLFSMLYLLTFYFGFPLTCMLVFQFGVAVVPVEYCCTPCCLLRPLWHLLCHL